MLQVMWLDLAIYSSLFKPSVFKQNHNLFMASTPGWLRGNLVLKQRAFDQRNTITHCTTDLLFIFLDSAALLVLNEQQFYLYGQIQTSQTGGQPYSDTSSYGQCSLLRTVN